MSRPPRLLNNKIRLPTRRVFLQSASLGAILIWGCKKWQSKQAGIVAPVSTAASVLPRPSTAVFSVNEWRVLEAITSRILPSEDGPGASEAGVTNYIDRQMQTRLLRPSLPLLRKGLELLDRWSLRLHSAVFVDLKTEEQDSILNELAAEAIPVRGFPQRAFFQFVQNLTLEGFFGDPVHGGNRDQIGWRTIGFSEPSLRTPMTGGHVHGRPH